MKPYEDARHSLPSDTGKERYRIDGKEWFAGSSFSELATTSATETYQVTIADLVSRALSKSNTSPAILGKQRAAFEAEIHAALEPFAQHGILQEQIIAYGSIFGRLIR